SSMARGASRGGRPWHYPPRRHRPRILGHLAHHQRPRMLHVLRVLQLYKYLFLWQFEQPPSSDTGGLFFPKAITHILVGLYIQQVCMAGLFFLARDQNQNMSSTPQAILM
ncbi:hypothetical protein B0H14DRAFT_2685503, partial [Mycena olivaceomarginata]